MATIKKFTIPSLGKDVEQLELSNIASGNRKFGNLAVFKKANAYLPMSQTFHYSFI